MRRVLLGLILTAVVVPLRATVLLPADLGDLAREARTIARGRVVDVESHVAVGRWRVETVVTLETERTLKGSAAETVQFRIPGGRVGRYRSIVVGAPEFRVGQRVIVFLGAAGPSLPYTIGLGQGVFRVVAGDDRLTVMPPAVLPVASGVPVVRGDLTRQAMPLADFEERVRALSVAAQ